MPFIEIPNSEGVGEPQLCPEGVYDLTITDVNEGSSERQTIVNIAVTPTPDIPNPKSVRHWLTAPASDQSPEKAHTQILFMKRFCAAFDVPWNNGFDPEDMPGKTARMALTQNTLDDGRTFNNLNLPTIPEGWTGGNSKKKRRG